MNNRTIAKSLIVLIIAVLTLSACGSPKVSEAHLNYGKKALSIVDSYLSFDITAKEARQQTLELYLRSDELPDEAGTENFHNNLEVESAVSSIDSCLSNLSIGIDEKENLKNLKKERNRLAEAIGEDLIEVSEDSQ